MILTPLHLGHVPGRARRSSVALPVRTAQVPMCRTWRGASSATHLGFGTTGLGVTGIETFVVDGTTPAGNPVPTTKRHTRPLAMRST